MLPEDKLGRGLRLEGLRFLKITDVGSSTLCVGRKE